ncbi:hypothetical protein, partial [Haloferula sp. A504]|uniref:hypothetical protein n=1 Tax=Haloferula sp. A504 TaxID=3373601 RepID=UPI0031CB0F43|nr:hypothetical protein [Verrucomicrobiaceae bacterium E54]
LKWNASGGGFTDNDADPDFFVFEDLGNDSVVAHAILGDGTLGAGVALSGWNVVHTDGALNGGEFTGRSVAGVAFDFTDLLDATGANLTNGTTIQGIVIGDTNDADFYEVYANVDTGGTPETSITITSATGGAGSFVLDWVTVPAGVPVTVRRSSNLDFGPGSTVVDSGNTSGTLTDTSAPSGKAFYRVESE